MRGAARFGVLVFLEHQHAGAFAQHETVAVLVPGPAGGGRIVVAGGQRARGRKTAHRQRAQGRLRAARNHHVRIAVLDHAPGITDAMRGGGAGGDHRQIRALQAVHDRQIARDHVDDGARDEERRDLARPAFSEVIVVRVLDHRQAADAGTDIDADALGVLLVTSSPESLKAWMPAAMPKWIKRIHSPRLFRGEVRRDIEILHLAGDPARKPRRVEPGDAGDAGLAGQDV